MVYLDYSASTPVSKRVLEKFVNDNIEYVGNANSMHKLGSSITEKLKESSSNILKLLELDDSYEIVYTSGASEANNLAIIGMFEGAEDGVIITSMFEHSSVIAPVGKMGKSGVKVFFSNEKEFEEIIRENLDKKILVSFAGVNSETGVILNIEKVKEVCSKYENVYLHIDATQAIGKVNLDYSGVHFISFSAHKIYGIKGVGCLVKKKDVTLKKQIVGGKSFSKYRSGTISHPLVFSLCNALEEVINNVNENIQKVRVINAYLISSLSKYNNVHINEFAHSVNHIVNISIENMQSKETVQKLSDEGVYISSYSACSSDSEYSKVIYYMTQDMEKAKTCVRISLSHLTTKEDIDLLIKALEKSVL